jgi:hypothetical protein
MNADALFSILNTAILPAWLLLIAAPRWRWTRRLVTSGGYSLVYALVYAALIILFFGRGSGGFSSLAGVQQLFSQPYLLLAGWLHYLAFDLLVGSWILKDAQARGMHHGWVIPSLLLTLLVGPIGWASYRLLRRLRSGGNKLRHL